MNRKLNHALASLVLMYSATAWSQEATMATINGQDEYQLSGRTECGGEATSTIKPGERFIARELSHGEGYWEVYLKSGISGSIPRNRIRLLPDEPLERRAAIMAEKEAAFRKLAPGQIHPLRGLLALLALADRAGTPVVAVTNAPRQNADLDLTTCANIRLILPHDPSVPSPSDAGLSHD